MARACGPFRPEERAAFAAGRKKLHDSYKNHELRKRHLQVLLHHLAGETNQEIRERFRMRSDRTVPNILKRPEVRAEIDKILAQQRERLVHGEFGVSTMAKANAIAAANTIFNQANGTTEGVSHRDARQAAELTLKLSGDLVEKKVNEHVHRLIQNFTTEELEAWVSGKGVPARVREQFKVLGIDVEQRSIIDVTPR
jgi:hypothetical protein